MTDQELLALCADVAAAQASYNSASALRDDAEAALKAARDQEIETLGKLAGMRKKLDVALGHKA